MSKRRRKRKSKVKRVIVTPDEHFPYEDKAAINVLCQSIEKIKPEIEKAMEWHILEQTELIGKYKRK